MGSYGLQAAAKSVAHTLYVWDRMDTTTSLHTSSYFLVISVVCVCVRAISFMYRLVLYPLYVCLYVYIYVIFFMLLL